MMRSATAFLPPCMITFMNLARSTSPNFGSGRISRLGTSRRRGIFSPLCFSWHRFLQHRESYHSSHLLDRRNYLHLGHFAQNTCQDESSTCFFEKVMTTSSGANRKVRAGWLTVSY